MKFQGFETKKNANRCTFYEGFGGHVGIVYASSGEKGWQFVPYTIRICVVCNQSLCNWHVTGCHLQLSRSYL